MTFPELGHLSEFHLDALKQRIGRIRESCGEICKTDELLDEGEEKKMAPLTKKFSCDPIFRAKEIDQSADIGYPPYEVSKYYSAAFTN